MFVGFIVSDLRKARMIKKKLKELFPDEEAKLYVLFNGWTENDIDNGFRNLLTKEPFASMSYDQFIYIIYDEWLKYNGDSIQEFADYFNEEGYKEYLDD